MKTCLNCPSLAIAGKTTHFYECTLLHVVLQADLKPVCGPIKNENVPNGMVVIGYDHGQGKPIVATRSMVERLRSQ